MDEEKRKFEAADVNKDEKLTKEEFVAFYHPYNYEHMHQIELQRVMNDHDKDKDGFLSLQEFLGDSKYTCSLVILCLVLVSIHVV